MFDLINKYTQKCEKALTYLSLWTIFIMMVIITCDATGRYFFKKSIMGVYEVTEGYLVVMAVFMAAGYTYRNGGCIRVKLFIDRMPDRIRIPFNYFVQVLSILFCLSLLTASAIRAFQAIGSGAILGNIPLPSWPGYMVVPIGLFFMLLPMSFDLAKVKSGRSALLQGDVEEDVVDSETTGRDKDSGSVE